MKKDLFVIFDDKYQAIYGTSKLAFTIIDNVAILHSDEAFYRKYLENTEYRHIVSTYRHQQDGKIIEIDFKQKKRVA